MSVNDEYKAKFKNSGYLCSFCDSIAKEDEKTVFVLDKNTFVCCKKCINSKAAKSLSVKYAIKITKGDL
jgi:hypothetical protein